MSEYRWEVCDPLGNRVVLKESTFEKHIMSDNRTQKQIEHMIKIEKNVRETIENPRYIYRDRDYEQNKRHRYIDLIGLPELNHIQALVVIVDTDRQPQEVVTWIIKRNLSKESIFGEGGIVYDAKHNKNKYIST